MLGKTFMSSTNFDTDEIKKFSDIQEDWWNLEGQCAPLHQINPLRLDFIQQFAELENKKILDVGCGGGILSEALAKLGGDVSAIDLSDTALQAARKHQGNLNIKYQLSSVEDFAEKYPESFDIITCMEMLEHVPDPASCIKACSQLIKPNGKLFFSTINRNLKSYLFAIIGAEWILKLIPKNTHDYAKFIRPSELSQWMREADLSPKDFQGMIYNPLTKKYGLNKKDISINYLVYAEKS
jgi:2-polyprenyl-6-hydroxyphenyl methylase/3-demethylubiquinone-9 3-methyltransferase